MNKKMDKRIPLTLETPGSLRRAGKIRTGEAAMGAKAGKPNTGKMLSIAEQRWRAGCLVYVDVAMSVCYRHGVPPPKWLVQAVNGLVTYALMTERKRGRQGNHAARWKRHVIDEVRWATVLYHKQSGKQATWTEAYERAADDLRGTAAQGTPRAMMNSYCRRARSDFIRSIKRRSEEEQRNFVESTYQWRNETLKPYR